MAQELHDTLIQGLAGLIMQLEAIDSHLEEQRSQRAQKTAQEAMRLARSTMVDARRAIQALRSASVDHHFLEAALTHTIDGFSTQSGLNVAFTLEGALPDVHPDVTQEIVRILQESLHNVQRHARVQQVKVHCSFQESVLQLVVRDEGDGFDPEQAGRIPDAFGIQGMHERARRCGGSLHVTSAPGEGTTVLFVMELRDDSGSDRG